MSRARAQSQDGFSLVEVMVAIVVLLVGVLGTVMMIDGANANTSRTKAREGGTALARTVLEVARGVPYDELTSARVLVELTSRAGLADADPVASGHQVESRGFTYTVVPTVCSMDDPKDAVGEHDLGVVFCANTATTGGTGVDRNPDDYRHIAVRLTWDPGTGGLDSTNQTGIMTNPVGGLGPSVIDLSPHTPNTPTITTGVTTASYDVITSTPAEAVHWFVNGRAMLPEATGEGTDWDFVWDLGPPEAPEFVDCTYVLQAEALDDKNRAGAPKALTVTLNRSAPFAPTQLQGGRNLLASGHVDLQWEANRECDVKGYKIYRTVAGVETMIHTAIGRTSTEYVDTGAPATGDVTYEVVAVDTHPDGTDRPGVRSAPLVVNDLNEQPPGTPVDFTVCNGGTLGCNDVAGNPAPSGAAVLRWTQPTAEDPDDVPQFYRVYRDGTDYDDRIGILFPVDPLVYIDTTASGSHTYYVSAVDQSFGESSPTAGEDFLP